MYKSKYSLSYYYGPRMQNGDCSISNRLLKDDVNSEYWDISGLLRNSQKRQRVRSAFSVTFYVTPIFSGEELVSVIEIWSHRHHFFSSSPFFFTF